MEIQTILRKLEPLMTAQVAKWRRTLDLAEPDVKGLLERQIRHTAHQVLGDFRTKPLLSLPPENKANGTFHLGKIIYNHSRHDFGISTKELLQNLAIFGRSGAGKTNVAFHLLLQLASKKVPFLFLDFKRTARHLIPILPRRLRLQIYTPGRAVSPFPFNPFITPPNVERDLYVNHLVDVVAAAYTLGDGAKHLLHKALRAVYETTSAPSLTQLIQALEDIETKGRAAGWQVSAMRALESLRFLERSANTKKQQERFAESLLTQRTVVELDALDQSGKTFLVPLLCFWIYSVQLTKRIRETLQFVIFVEEAHHVLYRQEHRAKETLMNQLLRQGRELGMCFIVMDQHPHLISSAVLGNCMTSICLNQKNPADINKAAGLSLLNESEKQWLSMLPIGQGVVKLQHRWNRPFLVQFPLVSIEKGVVTDAVLKDMLNGKTGCRETRKCGDAFSLVNRRFRQGVSIEAETFALLDDVVVHPRDGVAARYARLGLSADRGNRYKQQLVQHGLLVEDQVKIARTFRVVLRLTNEGRSLLRCSPANQSKTESLQHEYWKQRCAAGFASQGYEVQIEAPRDPGDPALGNVDVLATKPSESVRLAIEIETGKSDVIANVKRDLLAGFEKVLVVPTDEAALAIVERQLASVGLLLRGRVEIVLQDT